MLEGVEHPDPCTRGTAATLEPVDYLLIEFNVHFHCDPANPRKMETDMHTKLWFDS